jgi:hypothetical protein
MNAGKTWLKKDSDFRGGLLKLINWKDLTLIKSTTPI